MLMCYIYLLIMIFLCGIGCQGEKYKSRVLILICTFYLVFVLIVYSVCGSFKLFILVVHLICQWSGRIFCQLNQTVRDQFCFELEQSVLLSAINKTDESPQNNYCSQKKFRIGIWKYHFLPPCTIFSPIMGMHWIGLGSHLKGVKGVGSRQSSQWISAPQGLFHVHQAGLFYDIVHEPYTISTLPLVDIIM